MAKVYVCPAHVKCRYPSPIMKWPKDARETRGVLIYQSYFNELMLKPITEVLAAKNLKQIQWTLSPFDSM